MIKKLEYIDFIIIDEISMVKELFYYVFYIFKKIKPKLKFVIFGDFG
jgi:hypothetical protein